MAITKIKIEEDPPARPGYIIPFTRRPISISQGYNGHYSHFARLMGRSIVDDRFSLDFKLPPGTPVLAAMSGVVVGAIDSSSEYYGGLDFDKGVKTPPNFVTIRHDDGTKTFYAHLAKNSLEVRSGQSVKQGQVIAETGKSGWVGPLPHLHFEAYIDSTLRKSFPVVFEDYAGPLEHKIIEYLS